MDRRDFLRLFLIAPLFPKLLSASPPSSELFILSDTPQLVIPGLLAFLPLSPSPRPSFAFLRPHPEIFSLQQALSRSGWSFRSETAAADVLLSSFILRSPSSPSFTLVQSGRIRDIRGSSLQALWRAMQASKPSSLLTMVSFPGPLITSSARAGIVYQRGKEAARFPLYRRLAQTFEDADGALTVRVEGGRAWVSESSCAHQICRHSPPIMQPGERIICAPNHFLLTVTAPHGIDTSIG